MIRRHPTPGDILQVLALRGERLRSAEARRVNHERAQFEAFRRFWEDQGYIDKPEPEDLGG